MDGNLNFEQLLFRINKLYTQLINENLSELNVTRSDMNFLLNIYNKEPLTQDKIAKKTKLNNATVTRGLERLETKKLIKRKDNPNDKRSKIVSLTDNGEQIIAEIIKKHMELKEELLYGFEDDDYETMIKLLNKFHENLKIKENSP